MYNIYVTWEYVILYELKSTESMIFSESKRKTKHSFAAAIMIDYIGYPLRRAE